MGFDNHQGNVYQAMMIYHFTTIRVAIIKKPQKQKLDNNRCWWRWREFYPSCTASEGMEDGAATLENCLAVLTKVNHRIPIIWSSNATSGYLYSIEMKAYVDIIICTWMLIAALFMLAET